MKLLFVCCLLLMACTITRAIDVEIVEDQDGTEKLD